MIADTPTELEIRLFGYDAVKSTTRRKAPTRDLRSDDHKLEHFERDKLVSTARDAFANYAVAAWIIRKHLDFVAHFGFQANTPDDAFNARLTRLVQQQCKRSNCHVSGRHPLRRLMRIQEACRTLDGDVLIEKMRNRSLNLIRADRIRNPRGITNNKQWINGVHISRTKSTIEYQIHERTRAGSFVPEKRIPDRNAIMNGYWETDGDQIRGVSKFATAINPLRDTLEAFELSIARLKVEQLFGLQVIHDIPDGMNPFAGNQQFDDEEESGDPLTYEELAAKAEAENRKGRVDFGNGLYQVENAPGERLEILSGNMPSSNAQAFISMCVDVALKCLDLPASFADEARTNFYGQKGALQHYKQSCESKRADNQDVLDELTRWWITHWVVDGELVLPRGWKLHEIEFAWVPRGIPWWDRSKEIIGDMRAIGAGLDNPIDVCLDHGTGTPFENIDKTAKVLSYAAEKLGPFGLTLNFNPAETTLQALENAINEED